MADYVIGDLQGCFEEFILLLKKVNFNPSQDNLYLVGDIVARGPDSLSCLRYLNDLEGSAHITLGNHDLHLLATYHLNKKPKKNDKLDNLFNAKDLPALISFLQQQPLAIWLESYQSLICHAGLSPHWDLETGLKQASNAEKKYQGKDALYYFKNMYGNEPLSWSKNLSEINKFRYTINSFTRMRFLTSSSEMNFIHKDSPQKFPKLIPWYEHPQMQKLKSTKIFFGHWASLLGETTNLNTIALDTGCVWGNSLTLIELKSGVKTSQTAV
ncbi:symmetrical bis(5'-nucleosyl)-tetraphosphatase [Pseudoalteromonas denitrificans]|uniref:bis(5'-nucleosyl)-tetraphosphatase (symmetrical) n=1 Tax=Pseudoalteromonas denitrificans DSM 6059 TaxID=1123010 RepID=A0A1I1DZE6_9GAMM|nr:symmetrical bis(5'-nucleosyl)-tetraphosphatase [Pseudoalteromonas denitrificans]SFB80177.1 Bis(5'nucleosyl)-tetraphosphatase, ApaH [Pseudoalteromonas denitrificans DSM 6059]